MLAGCAALAPPELPVDTYELRPQVPRVEAQSTRAVVYVATPRASPPYDTPRMAYTRGPYALSHYAQNAWAAEPARLLEPWLVAALEASGAFAAVTSGPSPPPADYRLDVEIVTLRQEFDSRPSRMRVALRAQVLDVNSREVVATRRLEALEPAPSDDPKGGVVAANAAFERLLAELVELTAGAAGR